MKANEYLSPTDGSSYVVPIIGTFSSVKYDYNFGNAPLLSTIPAGSGTV